MNIAAPPAAPPVPPTAFRARLDALLAEARRRVAPETAMGTVARLLMERTGAHTVLVAQWDKIAGRFTCSSVFGACAIDLSGPEPCEFLNAPEFTTPEADFVESPFADCLARLASFPALRVAAPATATVRFLPLTLHDAPVGLLVLLLASPADDAPPPAPLPADERSLLAFYCASVLATSRLRSETMAKSARLATLYEMSKNTGSILEPGDVMSSLTEAAKALIKFETGLLFLRDGKGGKLVARRILGETAAVRDILDDPEACEVGRVIETRDAMLFHHGRLKSCLCVPVAFEQTVLGALFLGTEKQYAYDGTDLSSVGILASHFATIDNAIGALLAMRTYAKSFLDSMGAGLVAIDTRGVVTHMNAPAAELLDAADEAEGKPYEEAIAARPALVELVTELLHQGKVVEEHEMAGSFGERTVEVTACPFADGDGARLGVALFLRDVTDERRAAAEKRQSERLRALGEMTASIAHEIRNPLTGIKMISQLLEDEVRGFNPKLLEYTGLQIKEIERLNAIISDMLAFTRPARPQMARGDLTALLDAVLFLLEDDARRKDVSFARHEERPLTARFDEAQMKQVLFNVLLNAIDASHPGDRVEIRSERRDGEMTLSIVDHGVGVARDDLPRIFDPFYSTKERGTGLGLTIAHTIVKEHGGRVRFDSEKGRGTTFRITLPEAP